MNDDEGKMTEAMGELVNSWREAGASLSDCITVIELQLYSLKEEESGDEESED